MHSHITHLMIVRVNLNFRWKWPLVGPKADALVLRKAFFWSICTTLRLSAFTKFGKIYSWFLKEKGFYNLMFFNKRSYFGNFFLPMAFSDFFIKSVMSGFSICGTQGASFSTLHSNLMPSVLAALFWYI